MESKLQIISGKYRGRKLALPPSARPTQNRARIALFNMLESGIIENTDNLVVWDAFAGSGAFGIECISRYNATAIFTDVAPESIATIRKNITAISMENSTKIVQADAIGVISQFARGANLVFVDAPYDTAEIGRAFVNKLGRTADSGTILVWEQESNNSVQPNTDTWEVLRDKTYGRARFLILRKK
ncbi:MAG: RsmD family RNA methyltransferase [Alphaproteobacteria bacterium]|nr:RsmD family RNA methyltransferase [Alphaproteobacteria bacterium]